MEESERQALAQRAASLEKKQLYVKAAEVYLKAGMGQDAARALETCGAYERAEKLFRELGMAQDADRCAKKRDSVSSGQTWMDLQAEFQQDKGNPY